MFLKEKDKEPWNLLNDGNFSVNKSSIACTAHGADQALEQANKTMKIHGGIKGIVNNQVALDQYLKNFTHSLALPIAIIKNTVISFKEVKIREFQIM